MAASDFKYTYIHVHTSNFLTSDVFKYLFEESQNIRKGFRAYNFRRCYILSESDKWWRYFLLFYGFIRKCPSLFKLSVLLQYIVSNLNDFDDYYLNKIKIIGNIYVFHSKSKPPGINLFQIKIVIWDFKITIWFSRWKSYPSLLTTISIRRMLLHEHSAYLCPE